MKIRDEDEDGDWVEVGDRAGTKSLALGVVWRSCCPSQRRLTVAGAVEGAEAW